MSISKSQLDELAKGGLNETDFSIDDEYRPDLNNISLALFYEYADLFKDAIIKEIKTKGINASGDLADNIKLDVNEDGSGFKISMLDYYDFVNKGVKGVKSHSNAPNSPYKYKTFGMPKSARIGLRKYIESGKASIRVFNKKKTTIGAEVKRIPLIDLKVNTLIYWIKNKGIKTTNYFDVATESVSKDLGEDLMYLIGKTIVIQIGKPKKKKK